MVSIGLMVYSNEKFAYCLRLNLQDGLSINIYIHRMHIPIKVTNSIEPKNIYNIFPALEVVHIGIVQLFIVARFT